MPPRYQIRFPNSTEAGSADIYDLCLYVAVKTRMYCDWLTMGPVIGPRGLQVCKNKASKQKKTHPRLLPQTRQKIPFEVLSRALLGWVYFTRNVDSLPQPKQQQHCNLTQTNSNCYHGCRYALVSLRQQGGHKMAL